MASKQKDFDIMGSNYKLTKDRKHGGRKFITTFLSFFLVFAVVSAVLQLSLDKTALGWLEASNGTAGSNLFPFVYTTDNLLYVVPDETSTSIPVDDGVANTVYDAASDKVYYTRSNDLYEYDISKNIRVKVCGNVLNFYLFPERSTILYEAGDGSLNLYVYGEKKSVEISNTSYGIAPVVGKKYFCYFADADLENGTATLMLCNKNGELKKSFEGVMLTKSVTLLKNDKSVCFTDSDGLKVYSILKDEYLTFENAYPVIPENKNNTEGKTSVIETFGDNENVSYILTDVDTENNTAGLVYLKNYMGSYKTIKVSDNVSNVISYDDETGILIFTKNNGEAVSVYMAKKGKNVRKLVDVAESSKLLYESEGFYLYVTDENGTVTAYDTAKKNPEGEAISESCDAIYPYIGKAFAVIHSGSEKVLVKKNLETERYSGDEVRLYGRSDNTYISYRTMSEGVSIDIVSGDEITRIANNCGADISFDKNMKNIIYRCDGELFLYSNGASTKIGTAENSITQVKVLTKS